MSNYRLVKPGKNNSFYKSLAAISTLGILSITGIQVSLLLKEENTYEDQLAKAMVEITSSQEDFSAEVASIRSELLTDLNALKTKNFIELKNESNSILEKVENRQSAMLAEVKTIRAEVLEKLENLECKPLVIDRE